MSLPALWSCWQVNLIGMVPPSLNAVLVSLNAPPGGGGGFPPANLSRTITLSMALGVPPFLSPLVLLSHRPPSGDLMTLRSRPHLPLKKARGVSVPLPLIFMTHSREPRTA